MLPDDQRNLPPIRHVRDNYRERHEAQRPALHFSASMAGSALFARQWQSLLGTEGVILRTFQYEAVDYIAHAIHRGSEIIVLAIK